MGGDLRLDTLVKNGACFVLTLPLSRQGDGTAPP
jgi:signal transduction histidine kinase